MSLLGKSILDKKNIQDAGNPFGEGYPELVEAVAFSSFAPGAAMTNQHKPWLDSEGKQLSETEIMEAAKNWGGAIWEEFLTSTVEKPLHETLMEDERDMDQFTNSDRESYQELVAVNRAYRSLGTQVRSLVTKLTVKERTVILSIFWEGKSQRKIAKSLNLSRSSVKMFRDRALKKLGAQIVKKSLLLSKLESEKKSNG
jgi:DNA-directed RNA polymerase specialized sigma24 family protein